MKLTGRLFHYLRAEKEKVRDLSTGEKVQYILGYYWLWILGIGCGLFLAVYLIYHIHFTVKDYWLYGMFANTTTQARAHSPLWNDFVTQAGYDLQEKKVEFSDSAYFDPTVSGGTNNSYYQAFVALTEAGELDMLIMGSAGLLAIGSSGRLLDLNAREAGQLVALANRYDLAVLTCVPNDASYSREPVPVGIDLSSTALVTKYHLYEEDCALGVCAYSGRVDAVADFLEFLCSQS